MQHQFEFAAPNIDADGKEWFGPCYDFLIDRFREGGEAAQARHYTDEPDKVDVRFFGGVDPRAPFVRRVLIFLHQRYEKIAVDGAPFDPALATEVKAWRAEYRRQTGWR